MSADLLIEVAWKSMIVAGAIVALLTVMGRQAPANRVAVGGLGFAFLLLLPAIIMALTSLAVPPLEVAAPTTPVMVAPLLPDTTYLTPEPASETTMSLAQLALLAWVGGALAMLLRLVAGLATLRRWTNRAGPIVSSHWHATLDLCQAPKATRLLLSNDVSAPLSWGWRAPVILINPGTLVNHGEAQAVLAHEAAHLSRGDWPRLIAAKLVLALFWFNPFVWLLERLYLQDVEEAADAEATRLVEPAHYAQVLLNVARNSAVPLGANSIASGALSKRIRKVLGGRVRSRWERTWRIGALTSVGAIAGPIAAVQFVAPAVSAAAHQVSAITRPVSPTPVAPAIAPPVSPAIAPLPVAPTAAAVAPVAAVAAIRAPVAVEDEDFISRAEIERIRRDANEARAEAAIAGREAREAGARAREAGARARADAAIIRRDAEAVAARARAGAAVAMANARRDMARGADDMERGAVQMRQGAAQMREEARRLRDPAYRQKVIAEARDNQSRWGNKWGNKVPTDQELIDAIPKMEQGARKMDAGVEKMLAGAQRMREQSQKH